jgi:hypothetical protein
MAHFQTQWHLTTQSGIILRHVYSECERARTHTHTHTHARRHTRVYVSDSQKNSDYFSKQLFAEMCEDLSPNQGLFKFCMK